jgi:protein SCO1/2
VRSGLRSAAIVLGALVVMAAVACKREPEMPSYWQVPAFSLTDQSRAPFSSSSFAGHVVLVDFIYTNCADICPLLSANLRTVQDRLKAEHLFDSRAMLVSITVDPERDSPEVLAEYGGRFGADFAGWKFLTGSREALEAILLDGFKLPFRGPTPSGPAQPGFEISHTNRLILIDPKGMVRGILSADDFDVDQTVNSIRRLVS